MSDDAEVDDELTQLLDEMAQEQPKPPQQQQPAANSSFTPDPELPSEEELEAPRVLDLGTPTVPESRKELPFIQLAKQFGKTVNTILENCDADRNQLQNVAADMKAKLDQIMESENKVPTAIVEAWVAAVSKKADVNIGATKLLDSIAKLLAAGKNNELLRDSGDEDFGSMNFDDLLDQDKYDDEKR